MKPMIAAALALSSAVLLAGLMPCCAGAAEGKPNFIIFLADDLGYGELTCQGYTKQIPTPHVDSIAEHGIRFLEGHVAATYCSPSRAGLMTGRYPTRFGHEYNGGGPKFGLPLTETTMADRLKALGYVTCAIGKWHLGTEPPFYPTKRGFDEYMGCLANPGSYFDPSRWLDSLGMVKPGPGFYTTDAFADRAVDFLERNKSKPFFLYLPFNAEHAPLQATSKYLDRFKNISDTKRRTFAAMLSAMDDAVGRVMDKLHEIGQDQNTLVFFLSDNGGPTSSTTSSNGPLRGFKTETSEGGTRVPFMVQWPGHLQAGKTYEHPVLNLDILPTFVAAAGGVVDPAWKLDGVNLLPYLTGENAGQPHETIYWRFGPQWAIRDGDWKLVVSRFDRLKPRLINMAVDMAETNDLASSEPKRVDDMTAEWKAWNGEQKPPAWTPGREERAGKKKKKNAKAE